MRTREGPSDPGGTVSGHGGTPALPIRYLWTGPALRRRSGLAEKAERQLGNPSPFSCPECGGALWELADGGMLRYRCHVGHAYTADAMLVAETDEVEQLLSRLLRSHWDRAELTRRMAEQERARQRSDLADQLQKRAQEYEENAELMQRLPQGHGDTLKGRSGRPWGKEAG